MNKYIIFFNDVKVNFNLTYFKGVKYRISSDNGTSYILKQYVEPFYVPKEFENIDYTIGDIIND